MLCSKYNFRYGYYEILFKLPAQPQAPKTLKGHGGTFWLFSGADSVGYNYWSEIDIFEINASDNYHFARGTHYQVTKNSTEYTEAETGNSYFSPNTWHKAALNWTSNYMEFYYDDILRKVSYNYPNSISPMYIIINCGGNYTPTDNYCTPFDTVGADSTQFPYTLEIDYVKVWQLKKDCSNSVSLTSFNPATYSNMLHQSVTMGTNVSITNQSNQSFWGKDYILINEGTTIDNQSNVLFNVTDCNNITYIKKRSSSSTVQPPPDSFLEKLKLHY